MAVYFSENLFCLSTTKNAWNTLFRKVIPFYAHIQDRVITLYFLRYFQSFFRGDFTNQKPKFLHCRFVICLAQEHINRCLQGHLISNLSSDFIDLERYTFAAKIHLNAFSSENEQNQQRIFYASHCEKMLKKWKKWGHPEEAFWTDPHLVDLIMRTFLHKAMHYRDYRHTVLFNKEPFIKIQGKWTAWRKVQGLFFKDDQNRIYSLDANHNKIYWWYFHEGLIPWDKFCWNIPHALTYLKEPPEHCEVRIVTTHARKERWNVFDHYLKGVRHVFLQVAIRKGYNKDNPLSRYKDGELYSFGFGFDPKDFSYLSPLAALRGRVMIPDYAEMGQDDFCITPLFLTDKKVSELMDRMIKKAQEVLCCRVMDSNCATFVSCFLSEAQIIDLPTKKHLMSIAYEFLIPKPLRNFLDRLGEYLPHFICFIAKKVSLICHSVVFGPLCVLLGACRVKVEEDYRKIIKSHFSNIWDIFNPHKFFLNEVKMIAKWQTMQTQTYTAPATLV